MSSKWNIQHCRYCAGLLDICSSIYMCPCMGAITVTSHKMQKHKHQLYLLVSKTGSKPGMVVSVCNSSTQGVR